MRRPALRLASCTLAGAAVVVVTAPVASADPGQAQLPATSSAALNAPPFTVPHGRKLG